MAARLGSDGRPENPPQTIENVKSAPDPLSSRAAAC